MTSDGGVMLLGAVERRIGIAHTPAALIVGPRNPLFVTHSVADILRARILAIACGYEDADDVRVRRAEWLCDTLYCARGQAENLIKLHNTQLASDRTSCRSPLANQVRLVLHTGACWLMLKLREKPQPLASAEFATLRMRLLKIAARITEMATRVRIAFAAACPEAELFASLARYFQPAGP